MMAVEEISAALKDRRIDIVSMATGLHRNTIQCVRDGRSINPSHHTIKTLSDYLEGRVSGASK
jgi:hypothetical protein